MFVNDLAVELARVAIESMLQVFRESYRQRPLRTKLVTLSAGLFIIAFMAALVFVIDDMSRADLARRQVPADLRSQLDQLTVVEGQLRDLAVFVGTQREQVANAQALIERLQHERAQLEPLLNADRATVDALLAVQQQGAARQRREDLLLGFVFGLVGNVLVTIAFSPWWIPRLEKLIKQARARLTPQPSSDDGTPAADTASNLPPENMSHA